MALSNYTEIRDSALNWLNREGFSDLEDVIEDIMQIAQRSIWRTADLNAMLQVTDITITGRSITGPADLMRVKSLTLQYANQNRDMQGSDLRKLMLARSVGVPKYFASVGTEIYFGPSPNNEYDATLFYYAALDNIDSGTPTNWVSDNYPELILWGTVYEALVWLKDDNRAAVYKAKYDAVLQEILDSEEKLSHEGGSMSVKDPNRIQGSDRY